MNQCAHACVKDNLVGLLFSCLGTVVAEAYLQTCSYHELN